MTPTVSKWAYRIATILILGGFVMLCQPFAHGLFVIGFPVEGRADAVRPPVSAHGPSVVTRR